LPAEGGAAPARQRRHLPRAGREHPVQGNPGAVMAGPGDQDKLAENWNPAGPDDDAISADWATMLEGDGSRPPLPDSGDRMLNQDEIDSLLGFDASSASTVELTGVQALINSALVSYERLPMLEIVFDRLVRLATTSLRNFT